MFSLMMNGTNILDDLLVRSPTDVHVPIMYYNDGQYIKITKFHDAWSIDSEVKG
jgi:hypothetical protein